MTPSEPPIARRPRPAVNADNRFWYEGIDARELRIQACADCGHLRHPPSPMCPACRSLRFTWVVAAGTGTIYSYVIHHEPLVAGLAVPYVVVLVEVADQVRVIGNLLDGPGAPFGIGSAVELIFSADTGDDLVLPQWRLRTAEVSS